MATPTDVFIPAALGGMLHGDNAHLLDTKMVIEGANSPTTPKADRMLTERGVVMVPDVLANAGGVVVSYFEWVQNLQHFRWDEDEVNEKLAEIMRRAYGEVHARAEQDGVSLRVAGLRDRDRARGRGRPDARLRLSRRRRGRLPRESGALHVRLALREASARRLFPNVGARPSMAASEPPSSLNTIAFRSDGRPGAGYSETVP